MRIKRNVLQLVAGLAFALSASVTHAVATFNAFALTDAEITRLQVVGSTVPEAEVNWRNYITTAFSVVQNDSSSDADPSPENSASSAGGVGGSTNGFFWLADAFTAGQVSVPGFAESSAVVELLVTINNFSNEALGVDISSSFFVSLSASLDTAAQTLESLSAGGISDGNGFFTVAFPGVGPLAIGGESSPDTIIETHEIGAGGFYQFTVRASADGRISQVPAPATLALLGLGLAGIGYQRRKQNKAA
jgi:hypothetical protein